MKVIDLLNKIANGEEVPKKIKYGEYYYCYEKKYNEDWEEWECGYKTYTGGYLNIWREKALNDEVEIIEEEKKIPEKIDNSYYHLGQDQQNQLFKNTINEIIDYLKSKGDE